MIDYASIAPMMSLGTIIVGIIAALLIARAAIELVDIYSKKKSPRDVGRRPAGKRRQLSPSQKCIENYYNTYRKGA